MNQPTSLVGKFLKFHVKRGVPVKGEEDELLGLACVERYVAPVLTTLDPLNSGRAAGVNRQPLGKPPLPRPAYPAPQPLQFSFLKWIPGRVSVATEVVALMTGPMSGCIIFKYSDGGVEKIAHVGTLDSPEEPMSIIAKRSWLNIATKLKHEGISYVNPANAFGFDELNRFSTKYSTNTDICCYFTNGAFYAIALTQTKSGGEYLEISAVKQIMNVGTWSDPKLKKMPADMLRKFEIAEDIVRES
jgi:hypothetical protein